MVVLCQNASHYDPRHFPDPSRFLPDRFLEGYEPAAHRFAWRPFERGPRACMGQQIAMEEMRIVLLLTARWFDMEFVPVGRTGSTEVTYSDLQIKMGDQAFGELKLTASPRGRTPMRLRLSKR